MASKRKRDQICYLCGKPGADTRDHVVPRNLFLKPLPTDMITLPAHCKCNRSYDKDEEYFRIFITAHWRVHEDPLGEQVWDKKVTGSSFARSWKLQKSFLDRAAPIDLYSPAGLYLGQTGEAHIDWPRVDRVFKKIVRGLLYYHRHKLLLEGITLTHIDPQAQPELLSLLTRAPKYRIGDGSVFACAGGPMEDDWRRALWYLSFYKKRVFVLVVTPAEHLERK